MNNENVEVALYATQKDKDMARMKKEKNDIMNIERLDERKEKILFAIIKIYLETGEPVGSRSISKLSDIALSSATIRNEMSDLTDMGYIIQTHTSSGRIPSDKGYRMYVNNLMKEKDMEIKALRTEMTNRVDRLESTLKGLVENIAKYTNYGALISGPTMSTNKIKYVQLSNLEPKKILAVVVCEGNIIKTSIVETKKNVEASEILDTSVEINNLLSGSTLMDIESDDFADRIYRIKKSRDIIESIVDSIKISLIEGKDDDSIITYGANNFFKYKELKDHDQATSLLETFEKKKDLRKLLDSAKNNNGNGIQVYIGEESSIPSMRDCSVVTANVDFGNGMKGTVGVIGPKRMDYEKVLKTLMKFLDTASEELK